jgi:hypothetical protein
MIKDVIIRAASTNRLWHQESPIRHLNGTGASSLSRGTHSAHSHHTGEMENMRYEISQLRRAWLAKEEVVNSLSAYEFLASLRPPAT